MKSEVDARSRLIHVTAASILHFPVLEEPVGARPMGPLPYLSLFADPDCQKRLSAAICGVLHEILHPFGQKVIGCGRTVSPPRIVDFGCLDKTRRQAFPIFWLEEGKVDDMYEFTTGMLGKFRDGSQVHFVGDCFSLQKLCRCVSS